MDENVNVYLYYYPNGGVKKSVYKSHQQGGKDRWENQGGLAPIELVRAHYDTDKYNVPTDADKINSTPYDPWEGGDDGANTGGRLEGQHGWENGGKQLFYGTIGIVTAPITLTAAASAGSIWGVFTSSVSLANAIDDLGGVIVSRNDSNYESLVESMVPEGFKETVQNVKAGAGLITFTNGAAGIWNITKGATGENIATLVGVISDGAQLKDNLEELYDKED